MIGQSYKNPAIKSRAISSRLIESISEKYQMDFGDSLIELKNSGSEFLFLVKDICQRVEDEIQSKTPDKINKKQIVISVCKVLFKEALTQLDEATISRTIDLICGDGKGIKRTGRFRRLFRFKKRVCCVPSQRAVAV